MDSISLQNAAQQASLNPVPSLPTPPPQLYSQPLMYVHAPQGTFPVEGNSSLFAIPCGQLVYPQPGEDDVDRRKHSDRMEDREERRMERREGRWEARDERQEDREDRRDGREERREGRDMRREDRGDRREERREDRGDDRWDRREGRVEARWDRREGREERREARGCDRWDRREDRVETRWDRRDGRDERREDRGEARWDRKEGRVEARWDRRDDRENRREHRGERRACRRHRLAKASLITYIIGMLSFIPYPASAAIAIHMFRKRHFDSKEHLILAFAILELIAWVLGLMGAALGLFHGNYCMTGIALIAWWCLALSFGIPRVVLVMKHRRNHAYEVLEYGNL